MRGSRPLRARPAALSLTLALGLAACSTCGGGDDDENKDQRQGAPEVAAPTASLLDQQGTLAGNGSARANFDVPVQQGDHLQVTLTSTAFDPVLEVTPPGGGALTNDDWQGSRSESRLGLVAAAPGVMKVTVTSFQPGASGAFRVQVQRVGGATAAPQAGAPTVAGHQLLPAGGTREGEVGPGDATLADGRANEMIMVQGADAGPLELRIEATGATVPLALVMDPQGHSLNPTGSGVYPITQPGPHRLQLIAPAAGQTAGYRATLQSAQQMTTPTLSRSHHQLPPQTTGAALGLGQTQSGQLGDGTDTALPTGEPADLYLLQGRAGQQVRVEMRSEAFDSYLMVVGPSGQHWENDDTSGTLHSALDLQLPSAGTYRVVATAYRAGMQGPYELKVQESRGGNLLAATARTPTPGATTPATAGAEVTRQGSLAQGDQTLNSGELADSYNFTWQAGATYDVSVESSDFDTYVIVRKPDGTQQDNDDVQQGNTNSGLQVAVSQAGAYQVIVTSYRPGETGAYTLRIAPRGGGGGGGGAAAPSPAPSAAGGEVTEGELAQGDRTLNSGEFADTHTLNLTAGQRVRGEARSTAFDTYLILREPSGEQQDNDDAPGGGTTNSRIDLVAQQAGAYQVTVTSYRPGEQGPYQLVVSDGAGGGAAAPSPAPAPQAEAQPATGDMVRGELAQGDQTLDSGEFADAYSRSFQAGQSVQIRLASSALDPYLIVRTPSGRQLDNDDLTPQTRNAGVDIPAAEAGTYRILATSYRPGETGAYELSFGAGQAVPRPSGAGGSAGSGGSEGGRVFGLFAGITDYPDGVGDLPECANDAIKLAETLREAGLLQEANQVVLTDAQANRQNMRDAMQRFAGEMGPEDIFVFFYSGHGGQTQGSSDPREIDGTDEYLVLHDGPVLDNDLATLFDPVRARVSVVALDACFSGGFAKDLITRPGRVGFFSSEEDVLSAVAGQFQAGGYLSHFIRLAVSGDADMSPRDRVLTVGELSHFLYTQFGRHATDVQLQGAYQHLVVDRGAVTSDQVLWAYR